MDESVLRKLETSSENDVVEALVEFNKKVSFKSNLLYQY